MHCASPWPHCSFLPMLSSFLRLMFVLASCRSALSSAEFGNCPSLLPQGCPAGTTNKVSFASMTCTSNNKPNCTLSMCCNYPAPRCSMQPNFGWTYACPTGFALKDSAATINCSGLTANKGSNAYTCRTSGCACYYRAAHFALARALGLSLSCVRRRAHFFVTLTRPHTVTPRL